MRPLNPRTVTMNAPPVSLISEVRMTRFRALLATLTALAPLAATAACEEYDPPPEVSLVQPEVGFWTSVTPLELLFTEAIDPATLVVTVWPSEVDLEGNFRPDVVPLVKDCSLATSPCGLLTLELDETATKATLVQNDAFEAYEGKPLILEVHAGLADPSGRKRKVSTRFDFQVNPRCGNEPIDIDLESGIVSLTANLQVLPIWLHMYLDMAIDKATGRVVVVGTFARLEQRDPQLAPNYNHPDGFEPDLTQNGWAVTFTGCMVDQGAGQYFFQSDPFDVNITVLNTIPVTLTGFTVQGSMYDRRGTSGEGAPANAEAGRDFGSGTLSTSGGAFGDPPNDVAPITTAWDGFGFHPAEVPEGLPRTCAEDPCGTLDDGGGDCQIPEGFDPGDSCQ